ncbi:unnamed protein product, partial [Iphiclides podalirius]
MFKVITLLLLATISTECQADLSNLVAIPGQIFNSIFGTILGTSRNSLSNPDAAGNDSPAPPTPISSDSTQKIADKQGDGNYNQNINLHDNKGSLNLSSSGRVSEANYGNEQVARWK